MNATGSLTVVGGAISFNGNAAVRHNNADTTISISGATLTGNAVEGLRLNGNNSTVQLTNTVINGNNVAATIGINVTSSTTVTLDNVTVENNASYGIRTFNASSIVQGTGAIVRNNGDSGVYLNQAGTVNLSNSQFTNNTNDGLVVIAGPSLVTLADVTASNNSLMGLRFNAPTTVNITGTNTFSGNGNHGISVGNNADGSILNVSGATISGNTGQGILFARAGTFTVDNCLVTGNNSGISRDFESPGSTTPTTLSISNSTIAGNSIHGVFAKALSQPITLNVTNCLIEGNGVRGLSTEADVSSTPGVLLTASRNIIRSGATITSPTDQFPNAFLWSTLPGSSFVNNLVEGGQPAVSFNFTNLNFHHNTVTNDDTLSAPAAVINNLDAEALNIRNNIFARNDRGILFNRDINNNPVGTIGSLANLVVDYNLIDVTNDAFDVAITPGSNNIVGQDPEFVLASNVIGAGDYRVVGTSPAINSGTDLGVLIDLAGTARPLETAPDMGAYEILSTFTRVEDWMSY
jgi:hypothetical protein